MFSTSYTMWYWRSTEHPSKVRTSHLVGQGAKLIDAAKSELNDNKILVMPSSDTSTDGQQTSMEIAIFFPTSYAEKRKFDKAKGTEILTEAAEDMGLHYGNFVVQDKEDVQSFSREELHRIFAAANSSSDWVITTARAASAGVPAGKAASSFHIAHWRMERLRNARGDDIEKEVKSTLSALKSWKDGKSAWSTLLMIASGVAIISSALAAIAVIQNVSALVALGYVAITMEFITAGAILSAIAPWAALAGIGIGLGVLAFKGASNVMIIVNDTSSQIVRRRHKIANGKTQTETPVIEGRTKPTTSQSSRADSFVSVGIYAYSKDETFGIPLSFFGSLIGVSFSLSGLADGPSFSVGMDCPNSALGGGNSIRLLAWDDPSGVAGKANDCHDEEDKCKIAKGKVDVVVRRASKTGSINWGMCLVTEES
ncbi:hypothetical protein QBC35DRAFT_549095 [Podospora australis]|uniref:Uncharacterized protein n=1 Tax=Podospora australis TaxID=1536484 RepID=A0AAN6WIE2_9PEZI|nr:hypothetical protein QBC35DRAFT_549095 [Podospora australis]